MKRLSKKFSLMLSLSIAFMLVVGMPIAHAQEDQKAWLRMNAEGSTYVGSNSDPWISESYYIEKLAAGKISLGINVTNHKGAVDIKQIVLVIVTNQPGIVKSIKVNSTEYSSISWTTGRPPGLQMSTDGGDSLGEMPPHGVYNDATASWMQHRSHWTLGPKDSATATVLFIVEIEFTTPNPSGVKIHFDAYGWFEEITKTKKVVIVEDDPAFAPFSHDVTVLLRPPQSSVPEFPAVEIASAMGFCSYILLDRKRKRQK